MLCLWIVPLWFKHQRFGGLLFFSAFCYITKRLKQVFVCSVQQDEEYPGSSLPDSPPAFAENDPEDGIQVRRRAHTFSHPPVKKRISLEGQSNSQSKAVLHRQQSLNPELLPSR